MRHLVKWAAAGFVALPLLSAVATGRGGHGGGSTLSFSGVTYGQFSKYGNGDCRAAAAPCVTGDGWYTTWANDGNLYTVAGDTVTGWNAALSGGANIMFSRLSTWTAAMVGTQVNPMTAWGVVSQQAPSGFDYKASGLLAIGSTLYMIVYQHSALTTGSSSFGAQLLISAAGNYGAAWTPAPPTPPVQAYATSFFTDVRFRNPAFVQYPNQGYSGQTVDRSNQFVYAFASDASNTFYGGQADTIYLARVPIAPGSDPAHPSAGIGNQNIADWQYYQGGDGMLDASWGAAAGMVPVINEPGCKCHISPQTLTYLPYWKKYIYIDHTWPSLQTSTWSVYQLDHPWGPWVRRQSNTWSPGTAQTLGAFGFYLPGIPAQSVVADGGKTLTVLTAANYTGADYTIYMVPVTVNP